MADFTFREFTLGSTRIRYEACPRTGILEFSCVPEALADRRVPPRPFSTGPHLDGLPRAWEWHRYGHVPEWLTPYKLAGTPDPGGRVITRSLRGASDLDGLRFESQSRRVDGTTTRIETRIRHEQGFALLHVLRWEEGDPFFRVHTVFENDSDTPVVLDDLPSFSLGHLTPFHSGEAPEQLYLHRFRSNWSAEGRHERVLLEDLNLERSWSGSGARSERFGQLGSMPVRGFFPWAAVEDDTAGVMWGVQLSPVGSWQLELFRRKDKACLSGGLPSRDFGEWWKTVPPGESFASPEAVVACVHGDLDDLCSALLAAQPATAENGPEIEEELPMVFNEWCSSWGEPTHEDMITTARRLQATLTKILVIDDGWAAKPPGQGIQYNGDWEVDPHKFPEGLRATAAELRNLGFLPGLWFEPEAATRGTKAYDRTGHQLCRNGNVIQVGNRRFWDFRHPDTISYLSEKLIHRLKQDGFRYLKIDYNDCLPPGVDGEESPGEELRKHLLGVHDFLRRVQREIPGVIIENCASGGHRLEPGIVGLTAMSSFSDAHETLSIPIIAANLHRLIPARKNQVWCVLHPENSLQRIRYGLAATLMGRMAISGEICKLSEDQFQEIVQAQRFLDGCRGILRDGTTRLFRDIGKSWNEPRGWQALRRVSADGMELLLVVHTFGGDPLSPDIPLPLGNWSVTDHYGAPPVPRLSAGKFCIPSLPPFTGSAFRLGKIPGHPSS